jgi:aminoglycoside phosphotransferase (APT) family kinase protein
LTSDSLYESLARRRPPPEALRWAAGSIGRGAQIVSVRRLRGGTSTAIHAIDIEDRRGQRHRLVLRRFVRPNWQRPDLLRREAAVLDLLRDVAIPAPQLVAVDASAQACDVPALLMTRLSGRIDLTPRDMRSWLGQMAVALPPIHEVRVPRDSVRSYQPYTDPATLALPWWSGQREAWKQVLDLARGPRPAARACFIHRDYHPTNILWSRGRLSGVIDWINAAIGPPGIDLGHCRVNLVRLYGVKAADRFLAEYASLTGAQPADYDPYWDAISLFDSNLGPRLDDDLRRLGPPGLKVGKMRSRLDGYAVAIAGRC